jgi:hypothetical protein
MARVVAPALFGAAAALAAAGVVTLVSSAVRDSAKVGDIIAFEPSNDALPDTEARLVVHRPDQFGCVLDLAAIRHGGGSLVIEARLSGEGRRFRLHWAGERTTADSGDCGRSADLIVDRGDLDSLAMAAGGYGVGRKRVQSFTTALAN